jgi:hypothetical protein
MLLGSENRSVAASADYKLSSALMRYVSPQGYVVD